MLFGFHTDLASLRERSRVVHFVKGASVTLDIFSWPLRRAHGGSCEGGAPADSSSAKVQRMKAQINTRREARWMCGHTCVHTHPSHFHTPLPPSHTHVLKAFHFEQWLRALNIICEWRAPLCVVHCCANSPAPSDMSWLSKWSHISDEVTPDQINA